MALGMHGFATHHPAALCPAHLDLHLHPAALSTQPTLISTSIISSCQSLPALAITTAADAGPRRPTPAAAARASHDRAAPAGSCLPHREALLASAAAAGRARCMRELLRAASGWVPAAARVVAMLVAPALGCVWRPARGGFDSSSSEARGGVGWWGGVQPATGSPPSTWQL